MMSEINPNFSAETPAAVHAERRTRVRYTAELQASCRRTGEVGGQSWPGKIVNISSGGVGLLLNRRFQGDTLLDVELQGFSGGALRVLRVQVIHCTLFKHGSTPSWLLGCTFAKDLADEQLWPLLSSDGPVEE
jgi:PilZ domain